MTTAAVLHEPTTRSSCEVSLGELLGRILVESGVTDLFCIPGDFTMQLSRELVRTPDLRLRAMSHEYGTTLAALGYACAKGVPGAICLTYGVGVMNALNAIAQAFVERVPLVVVSGGPGKRERDSAIFLHHQISDHDAQRRIVAEVTAARVRIVDPHAAPDELREAVATAIAQSRPVYIEIPRDLYSSKVRYLPRPRLAVAAEPRFSAAAVEAAECALELLGSAERAVAVPGLEVKRFRLADSTRTIFEALRLPWVSTPMSQATLRVSHPNYRGLYAGPASPSLTTRRLVEEADVLVMLGEPNSDVNMGLVGRTPIGRRVHVHDGSANVGRRSFSVSTEEFVHALLAAIERRPRELPDFLAAAGPLPAVDAPAGPPDGDAPLRPFDLIQTLARVLDRSPELALVVDCGDSFFMTLGLPAADVLTSCLYMSMGIAVPGALGYQLGGGARPIVLVGDGAFQMTGLELMHARRFGVAPIVVVLNNRRWSSLSVDDSDTPLTERADLSYERLARFLGIEGKTATSRAALEAQLFDALDSDEPTLIDAQVDPADRSYLCERFFEAVKSGHHLPRV